MDLLRWTSLISAEIHSGHWRCHEGQRVKSSAVLKKSSGLTHVSLQTGMCMMLKSIQDWNCSYFMKISKMLLVYSVICIICLGSCKNVLLEDFPVSKFLVVTADVFRAVFCHRRRALNSCENDQLSSVTCSTTSLLLRTLHHHHPQPRWLPAITQMLLHCHEQIQVRW